MKGTGEARRDARRAGVRTILQTLAEHGPMTTARLREYVPDAARLTADLDRACLIDQAANAMWSLTDEGRRILERERHRTRMLGVS